MSGLRNPCASWPGVAAEVPLGDFRAFDDAAAHDADLTEGRSPAADLELTEADGDGLANLELDVVGDVSVEHEGAAGVLGVRDGARGAAAGGMWRDPLP